MNADQNSEGLDGGRGFYGWRVVAMAFLANFLSVGTGFYLLNVYMEPMCAAHGWSRSQFNGAPMLATAVGLANQVLYGALVMRYGPRALMPLGAIAGGVFFALLGRVETLWQFYVLYVALFMGNGAYGGIVANTAVNNWFVLKRGRAMGLATVGVSFSGFVVPSLFLWLIKWDGLEHAFLYAGGAVVLTAPLFWRFARNRPEDHGQLPDGLTLDEEVVALGRDWARPDGGGAEAERVWRFSELVRTGAFWRMGIAYGLVMIGVVGVMSQLKPHFTDVGYSDRTAALLMGLTALLGAAGKFSWAALCDRFEARRVAAAVFGLGVVGLGLLLADGSRLATGLFVLVFGFAMGGVMSTFPVLIATLYGRESFAAVARFVGAFLVLQALGYIIAGQSADLTGSYATAYAIFMGLDVVALALVWFIKAPAPREEPGPEVRDTTRSLP